MSTTLYLRSTQNNLSGYYDLLISAGSSSAYAEVNTVAGGTEIQWTLTRGGSVIKWASEPFAAGFTLTAAGLKAWAQESNAAANSALRFRLFKYSGGTETELGGGPFTAEWELPTSLSYHNLSGDATDTSFAAGDRLVLKCYITNVGTMGGSRYCTLAFNSSTYPSRVEVAETVGFQRELVLADALGVNDSLVKAPGKALADAVTLSDEAKRAVEKALADSVTLSDVLAKLAGVSLGDSLALSDECMAELGGGGLSLEVWPSDSVTLGDALAKEVGKGLVDSALLADALSKLVGKALADTATLTDAVAKQVGLGVGDEVVRIPRGAFGIEMQGEMDFQIPGLSVDAGTWLLIVVGGDWHLLESVSFGGVPLAQLASHSLGSEVYRVEVWGAYFSSAYSGSAFAYTDEYGASCVGGVAVEVVGLPAAGAWDVSAYDERTSTTPSSGYTGLPSQAHEFALGIVATNGPPTDAPGTWIGGLTEGQRDGYDNGWCAITVSEGYRVTTEREAQVASKTGITLRPWGALIATFRARDDQRVLLSDFIARQVGMVVADSIALADAAALTVEKALADVAVLTDAYVVVLNDGGTALLLNLEDVLALTDAWTALRNYLGFVTELEYPLGAVVARCVMPPVSAASCALPGTLDRSAVLEDPAASVLLGALVRRTVTCRNVVR